MLRLLVAGDIRMYRDGVAAHLRQFDRFALAGTAADADETLRRARELAPDVVVIDLAMPGALAAARAIAVALPSAVIVALTVPEVEQEVLACAEAGVVGYVPRDGSLDDLVAAVDRAARGEALVPARIVSGLLRRVAALSAAADGAHNGRADPCAELTPREREVVALIERGLSNKQIAAGLQIELATVKNHVHNILEKLHVERRAQVPALLHTPPAPRVRDGGELRA